MSCDAPRVIAPQLTRATTDIAGYQQQQCTAGARRLLDGPLTRR